MSAGIPAFIQISTGGEQEDIMTKTELIAEVAEKTGLKKKDAEAAVAAVLTAVEEKLAAGEKVQLVGFGTFEVKERPEREGRNPATGATIRSPPQSARFSPQERLSATR